MQENNEQRHFLALMYRPGDYAFIDISKLDIARGYNPILLQDIDSFTMHYTKNEIMAAIISANIASAKYLSGTLVISDNQKHNPIMVIDKDFYDNFQIDKYILSKKNDKNTINTIINKFKAINKDEDINQKFSESLKNGNIIEILDILFNLPYLDLRKMMIYLIELREKELNKDRKKELIRDKAA